MNRSSIFLQRGFHLGLALGAVLATSCGDTANPALSPLNLDRPIDIAFACYGGLRITNGGPASTDQALAISAQPTTSCETRSLPVAPNTLEQRPPGQEDFPTQVVGTADWYGFILQSSAGTVALAHWNSQAPAKFLGSQGSEVQVLDADPLTPGKNAIAIGEEPVAIATDKAGCYEITANAGSCDMSVLDINSALAGLKVNSLIAAVNPGPGGGARVDRIPVKNQHGKTLLARPAAMVAEPSTSADVIGNACKAVDPTVMDNELLAPSGLLYVAYPSCHLVAAIKMDKDKTKGAVIVAGIQFDALGAATAMTADQVMDAGASCPVECGATTGASVTAGARPVTLAYRFDPRVQTRRLAIGAENSGLVTLVELGADSLPTAVSQIKLEDPTEKPGTPGKLGVTSIALSEQLGMGGNTGDTRDEGTDGGQGQYVYAVATDNSVRVVDVLNLKTECDTQVDTRFLRDTMADDTRFHSSSSQALACFAVGAPTTPPRRSGARGPGIEVPGDGVPVSVAFIKAPPIVDLTKTLPDGRDTRVASPATLLGTFAVITATNGGTFVVNVDDDDNTDADIFTSSNPQLTAPVLIMAHQLRDTVATRDVGAVLTAATTTAPAVPSCLTLGVQGSGGPRATTPPAMLTSGGPIAATKLLELPTIRQVNCTTPDVDGKPSGDAPPPGIAVSEVLLAASSAVRDQVFPDLRALAPTEAWTLTWEGSLSQDTPTTAIDGPAIREALMTVQSSASSTIDDKTRPFCGMGVQPFDILQIRGCDPNNQGRDCPSGYSCFVHPDRSVAIGNATIGSCMLTDEAPRLANACRDFLISLRRYTIGHAESGELVIQPRQHVLRTTPLDGCTDDTQCSALATYSAQVTVDPGVVVPAPLGTWQCLADPTRAPINPDAARNKRCVQRCGFHSKDSDSKDRDADCDPGSICQGATAAGDLGFCMEGVMPPQACVNAPQRFELRASEAFTVIGSTAGYVHPIIEDPSSHLCVVDPAAKPVQVGRIPLTAPACGPDGTDPITGELAGGGFEPNPCTLVTPQFEFPKVYPDANCDRPATVAPASRQAPAIRFRNRGLTLTVVDPFYPGDQTCPVDRLGFTDPALAGLKVPLVFPGYELSFTVTSGYTPLSLTNVSPAFSPAFPIKVVSGPSNSIWVLDDGDFQSTTPGIQSTRGQVYRIESINLGVTNLLQ
jgi:hypothetical protein